MAAAAAAATTITTITTILRQNVQGRSRVTTLKTTPTPMASPVFTVSCGSYLSYHFCVWVSAELQKFTFCFKFYALYSDKPKIL
jgi:hypothetical protein